MNKLDFSVIDKILEKNDYSQTRTIAILQDIQEKYHYLPKEIFSYVSEKLGISRAKLYSVATFYENF